MVGFVNITNLQAHDIIVITPTEEVVFPSEGRVQVRMDVRDVTGNGLLKSGHWTHTRGLPRSDQQTLYIVSALVAMFELFSNDRTDLLFPWGQVRDSSGRTLGCKALCRPVRASG